MLSVMDAACWALLAAAGGGGKGGGDNGCAFMMPGLMIIAVLFFFLVLRPQQRERSKREETLKTIKKNDRVVTIGGIIGVVANVTPESNEVTLKIDETTNTKIKVLRSSIHEVLVDEKDKDKAKSDDAKGTKK